jgi:hypothetical protein
MTEPAAGKPQPLWAVQWASGGIPESPYLLDSYENALRLFAETAVANGLEWTGDSSGDWIGNDDDEVRLYGPIYVWGKLEPPTTREWKNGGAVERPFTDEENEMVRRILEAIDDEKKADQLAAEVLAEDMTPERPGGCD